ncbi:MAG: hypothetical protein HFI70_03985 [Lachnospiraceae bacterium]|nr:hypothetical protein [Lachnospiraceae bacterium]
MTVKELGQKCKELDCGECQYGKECAVFSKKLEDISPSGLLLILDEELNDWN